MAIKLLAPRAVKGRDTEIARTRLRREAQAMARLSHPNVVQVYEVGEHDGQTFLALEFVRGQTLRKWMRERLRPWPETFDVFLQVGRGLEAAHRAGVIHRNFKPDNVIVGFDGRARVLDFGLARGQGDTSVNLTTESKMPALHDARACNVLDQPSQ